MLRGGFERLIETAQVVNQSGLFQFALIGGLAVAVRLTEAAQIGLPVFDTRATTDVDAAVQVRGGSAPADFLVGVGVTTERHNDNEVVIDGINVQTIPVQPVTDRDLEGLGPSDALFLAGHWYAAESAAGLQVRSGKTTVGLRVAIPAALLVTKLHAAVDRKGDREPKVAGDILDIHHLLAAFDRDGGIASDLATRPRLAAVTATIGERVLIDQSTRHARAVQVWSDPTVQRISADDLRDVGDAFVSRLRARLRS